MGNLIDKLKKDKPAFLAEFNDFVQKIRLENNTFSSSSRAIFF